MNASSEDMESFNPTWLTESCGDDQAAIRELIGLFVTQATGLWSELTGAVAGSDWSTAARLAHKMAGSCGACGLPALGYALRDFEKAVADDAALATERWPEVRRQVARAANELNQRFEAGWNPETGGSGGG